VKIEFHILIPDRKGRWPEISEEAAFVSPLSAEEMREDRFFDQIDQMASTNKPEDCQPSGEWDGFGRDPKNRTKEYKRPEFEGGE
jgi:hypothetical protein